MKTKLPKQTLIFAYCLVLASAVSVIRVHALPAQTAASPASAVSKVIGVVQSVSATEVVVKTDAGATSAVQVAGSTRILRSSPEQKSLKDATPIVLADVQAGDRVLAAGRATGTDGLIIASTIVVMKQSDIARKQQQELQDWQRRGVGGLVMSVDPAAGIIRLGTSALGQKKEVTVRVSKNTGIRRYAPDSVKFQDAVAGTLEQVKPGDQLRARGTRSEDGSELAADAIVSGTFRNISGEISTLDEQAGTITVRDLATKHPVTVRITAESQMRKLPEMMARLLARRLKGEGAANAPAENGGPGAGSGMSRMGAGQEAMVPPPANGAANGNQQTRPGDLQSMLTRAPAITLADLRKGDAVMLVSTEGTDTSGVTAITLLGGVEPVLTASPAASFLSPWNLSTGGAGEGGGEGQ